MPDEGPDIEWPGVCEGRCGSSCVDSASDADSYSARMPTRLDWLLWALERYAFEPLLDRLVYSPVGEGSEGCESIVLTWLMAGEGVDMSGGDKGPGSTRVSTKVSTKIDLVKLSRGRMFGRFITGCAQSGIFISTCLGRSRKESTEVLRTETPYSMQFGCGEPEGEELKVEKEPLRVSLTGLCLPKDW